MLNQHFMQSDVGKSTITPFYVERNGNIQVEEFKTKEEALAFISKKVEENVNISWALCKSYPTSKQPIDKWKLKIS